MWCPGVLLASSCTTLAFFRDELPTTRPRRRRGSSGGILQSCARFGRRESRSIMQWKGNPTAATGASGGGDANVFRMLAQKIKDLELNQSLLSRYVESLNTRYGETLEQFGKEIDEIEDGVSNSTEQLDEASRKARESSKACDDAVDRATQTSVFSSFS